MLSNTWDANRICRFLGYTRHILVIRMVIEITYILLKIGRCVEHPEIYKVLQRSYKVRIIYFLESLKSFVKTKKQSKTKHTIQSNTRQSKTSQGKAKHHKMQYNSKQYNSIQSITRGNSIQDNSIQWGDILPVVIVSFKVSNHF